MIIVHHKKTDWIWLSSVIMKAIKCCVKLLWAARSSFEREKFSIILQTVLKEDKFELQLNVAHSVLNEAAANILLLHPNLATFS